MHGQKNIKLDMNVWMKPGYHTHIEYELRFPPQYHTSYKWGYRAAQLHRNVASGFCDQ